MKDIQAAERELAKLDPLMGELIKRQGTITHEPHSDYFASLARSITGQQISVKAAAKIFERLQDATALKPQRVVILTDDQIKAIGLSGQKARYIRDLAEHFVQDSAIFNHLESLPDDQVVSELTKIKGIGIWTAQMFLMFTLVRLDVFAPDDVGLQQAIKKLYNLEALPKRKELSIFAERWRPYRTIACWHLWHLLDNKPS